MFNTSLRSANRTKLINQDPFKVLPLYSHSKTKYQTPYKPSNTTNVTRNATMSLYSFTSKKKSQTISKKQTIPLNPAKTYKSSTKSKNLSATISTHFKSKYKPGKIGKKNKKKIEKPSVEYNNLRATSIHVQNNLSLYRSRNMNLDGEKKVQLMGKISKIFDLVMLNSELPTDIELLLRVPIHKLRKSLKNNGRAQIALKMMTFKNECSDILKQISNGQVCLFLRSQLPSNSRWQLTNPSFSIKKQAQRSTRERYYQSLIPKQPYQPDQSIQKLQAIENRLDYFLQNSLKNRKVYI